MSKIMTCFQGFLITTFFLCLTSFWPIRLTQKDEVNDTVFIVWNSSLSDNILELFKVKQFADDKCNSSLDNKITETAKLYRVIHNISILMLNNFSSAYDLNKFLVLLEMW